jgi:hypothetical protein
MTIDERDDDFAATVDDDPFDPPEEVWGSEGEVPTLERDVEFVDEDLIIK